MTRELRDDRSVVVARADLYGTIEDFWSDYLELRGERYRRRQELLSLVEHSVYAFLTASPQLARSGAVGRNAFLGLLAFLTSIQTEHTAVIDAVMPEPHVYASDAPDFMTGLAWRALKGGNQAIQILDGDQLLTRQTGGRTQRFDSFRTRILAAFARMLSTAGGRTLVTSLLTRGKTVKILPKTTASDVMAQALRHGLNDLNLRKGIPLPPVAQGGGHIGPAVTGVFSETMTIPGFAIAMGNAKANVDIRSGETLPPLPDTGSASIIALDPGICDSTFLALDSLINPLPTPLFLTLAHELIHALHNAYGVSKGQFFMCDFDNREEYETISGSGLSENSLRAEHQLGRRHGHAGFYTVDLRDYLVAHPQVVIPPERALTYV